jgi:hypothetical protein
MHRIGAVDDEIQLRALLVLCAIAAGRLTAAEDELAWIDQIDESTVAFGGVFRYICRAELMLASGDSAGGLRGYRECVTRMRELEIPGMERTGAEPWALFGDAMALSAHAWYARGEDSEHGQALFSACRAGALKALGPANPRLDYPATGLLLFALGAWGLLRKAAAAPEALRLLALADRFAYNRTIPTMQWERMLPPAEEAQPGALAGFQAEYAGHRPPDLLGEARRLAERLPA